jgi:Zn ribbon nucleic-acid-binding protein
MCCPKCKAKIGVVKHEIMLDSGVIYCTRCVICGYWSQPYPTYNRHNIVRQNQAIMEQEYSKHKNTRNINPYCEH